MYVLGSKEAFACDEQHRYPCAARLKKGEPDEAKHAISNPVRGTAGMSAVGRRPALRHMGYTLGLEVSLTCRREAG